MKKKGLAVLLSVLIGGMSLSSCIGGHNGFAMTGKLYGWNKKVTGNKFVNEIIFFILAVIPVYFICGFIDVLILNSIEFWTGSNPMAMGPGETDVHFITKEDSTLKVEVSQNRYFFEITEGQGKGETLEMLYDPQTEIWSTVSGGEQIEIAKFLSDDKVMLKTKSNGTVVMDATLPAEEYRKVLTQ